MRQAVGVAVSLGNWFRGYHSRNRGRVMGHIRAQTGRETYRASKAVSQSGPLNPRLHHRVPHGNITIVVHLRPKNHSKARWRHCHDKVYKSHA